MSYRHQISGVRILLFENIKQVELTNKLSQFLKSNSYRDYVMIDTKSLDQRTSIMNSLKRGQQVGSITMNNMGLVHFPQEVCTIDEIRFDQGKWWEINPVTKIDLAFNQIKEIPRQISNLKDLVSLRMSNNELEEIPDELFTLAALKSLEFSNNKIKYFPLKLIDCFSIVEVNLSNNLITTLPNSYRKLKNIEILNLSSNKITIFGIDSGDFGRLKKLDLSSNNIAEIVGDMGSMVELEFLSLAKNKIQTLSQEIFRPLKNLKLLDLKENRLTHFEEFPKSNRLDSLFLAYNQLTSLRGFENSPNVTVLDLKNNKLTTIDKTIYSLKQLKTLDLMNNDLTDIPSEIGFLNALVRINIEGNPLKCIRSTIKSGGTEQLKKFLRERNVQNGDVKKLVAEFEKIAPVDLYDQYIKDYLINGRELVVNNQSISDIHDKFCALNLSVLDLSKNEISAINPKLSNLKNLIKLRLNQNKIEELPSEILMNLNQLEELELRGNKLTSIFDGIPFEKGSQIFPRLKVVDLTQNRFGNIPEFLVSIPSLRSLALAYNKLTDISVLFTPQLPCLEILDVSNNKIELIQEDIYVLKKLEHLNLENNSISKMPTILGVMDTLKNLKIYGNPIKNMKRELMEKPSKVVLDYLRDKHPTPVIKPQTSGPTSITNNKDYNPSNYSNQMQMLDQDPRGQNMEIEYDSTKYIAQNNKKTPPLSVNQEGNMKQANKSMPVTPQFEQSSKIVEETSKVDIKSELERIDDAIMKLENDLQNNYNMPKQSQLLKKKEINNLRATKNKLLNSLN